MNHRLITPAPLLLPALCLMVVVAVVGWWQQWNQPSAHVAERLQGADAVVASTPQEKPRTVACELLLVESGLRQRVYIEKDAGSLAMRLGDGLQVVRAHEASGLCFVRHGEWHPRQVSLEGLPMVDRSRLWFLHQRARLLARMRQQTSDDDAYAVLAAMTLGDKSALSSELKDVYATTGASHILALSGLHLSIIYMLLSLFVVNRRWRRLLLPLVVVAIWAFALLTGLSASVVRSATMLSVYSLLSLGGRRKMSLNVLAFTLIVMLIANPRSLFDLGFQLSFLAVLGILLWWPLAAQWVPADRMQRHPLLRWAYGMVVLSVAAQLFTAPLIAYTFGRVPTYFLLTNFIVIPAAYAILMSTLLVLLLPFPVIGQLAAGLAELLNRTLTQLSSLPGASIEGLHPSLLQVAMAYVVLLCAYLAALHITSRAMSLRRPKG